MRFSTRPQISSILGVFEFTASEATHTGRPEHTCTRLKYFGWPLIDVLLLYILGVLPQSKHLILLQSSAKVTSSVSLRNALSFS